jgi:hypothetical protein
MSRMLRTRLGIFGVPIIIEFACANLFGEILQRFSYFTVENEESDAHLPRFIPRRGGIGRQFEGRECLLAHEREWPRTYEAIRAYPKTSLVLC